MDFLKNIAIPQSYMHFQLDVFIATLSSLVFLPYVGFVLGSSIFAYWYDRRGRRDRNAGMIRLAHSLIDVALYNKSLITFLAVIPGLSIVLSYAQMLQQTPSMAVSMVGFGFLFLLVGCTLLYSYKYTFRVAEILESYRELLGEDHRNSPVAGEVSAYEASNERAHFRSGRWGIVFIALSSYLYLTATAITIDPLNWSEIGSIFSLLFTGEMWLSLFRMVALFAGITGLGMLYFSLAAKLEREGSGEYLTLVHKLGTRLTVGSLLTLPVLIYVSVASVPESAMSEYTYLLAGGAILLFFFSAHFIYGYGKSNHPKMVFAGLAAFVLATWFLVVDDYTAIGTSARNHAVILASEDEKSIKDLEAKLGITGVVMTGEQIYQVRCSSCHLFDAKKVGPPYFETVPRYKGNKADLISFIMNPTIKDPGYPPMPNPGLKPAEADSIASYLIRTVAAHDAHLDSLKKTRGNKKD